MGVTMTARTMATLGLLSCLLGLAVGQEMTLGRCRNYQTSPRFDQTYVDKMLGSKDGYILAQTNGGTDPCQRLRFFDTNDYNYTFIDVANFPRNFTDRYTVSTGSPTSPAVLHLDMMPTLLGSTILGDLDLYPLVARDDLVVFVSCRPFGLLFSEQILVFVPYASASTVKTADLITKLKEAQVPRLDELKEVSMNCVPLRAAAPAPLPLQIYNFLVQVTNPFRPPASPSTPAETTNRVDSTPAAFYTSTGGSYLPSTTYYTPQQQQIVYRNTPVFSNAPTFYPSAGGFPQPQGYTGYNSPSPLFYGLQSPAFQTFQKSYSKSLDSDEDDESIHQAFYY